MPRLIKIENNSAVSNYTPKTGNVTAFLAEENGNLRIKVKTSSGTIKEISGGSGGSGPFDIVKVTSYIPGTPMTLTGVKATAYDTSTNTWTFDSVSLSFTSFEKTPNVGDIYAATGDSLIGDPIEASNPLSGNA